MKTLNTFKTFKREVSVDGGGDGSIPMDDLNGEFKENIQNHQRITPSFETIKFEF